MRHLVPTEETRFRSGACLGHDRLEDPQRATGALVAQTIHQRTPDGRLKACQRAVGPDNASRRGKTQPRITMMEVEIGQRVYVPDPNGNPVRSTVIARGEPGDAVEMNVDGHAVKRDVAIVRHEEGKSQGFIAHVPYVDLKATADE
jgi:hypothetical protein